MTSRDADTKKKATYAWRKDHPEQYAAQHRLYTEINDLKLLLNSGGNAEHYQIIDYLHFIVPHTTFIAVGLPGHLCVPLIGTNDVQFMPRLPQAYFLDLVLKFFLQVGEYWEFRDWDTTKQRRGWQFWQWFKSETPRVCQKPRELTGIPKEAFVLREGLSPEERQRRLHTRCARGFFVLRRSREDESLNLYDVHVYDTELLLKVAQTDLSLYQEMSTSLEEEKKKLRWYEVEEVVRRTHGKETIRINTRWVYSYHSFDDAQSALNKYLTPCTTITPQKIFPLDESTSAAITRGRRRKLGV